MALGNRISELREKRGWSQSQLAEKLHIGTSTLGMWETDKRKPSAEFIVKLAEVFHVSTDYLLESKSSSEDNLSENQKLVAYSIDPDVSDEEREAIIEMVKAAKKFKRRI